jgi:MFS family permease
MSALHGCLRARADGVQDERGDCVVRLRLAAATTYGGLPKAFWWLWLGSLINRLGGFIAPFLAFYLTGPMHHSTAFAGAIAALLGFGSAVSGIVGGVLTDRIGRKPTLLGSLTANAATIAALGFARSPWLLAVGALAVGLASNAYRPASSAMIADLVPAPDRVRAYALNFWAINLGFAFSMAAIGLVTTLGYRALFLADAASTLLCALLIAVMVRDTTPSAADLAAAGAQPGGGMRAVLRDRVYVAFVATTLAALFVLSQCNAGQPMAMARDGLTAAQVGWISSINGVLIVLLQIPMTRRLKRWPERQVLAVSYTVMGLGFAVLLFGHSIGVFALSVAVWTLGEIGTTPTNQAIVARLAPANMRGRYMGLYQMAWTGASILAPLVGGVVFGVLGPSALWIGCLVLAGAAGLVQLRIGRHVERRINAVARAEEQAAVAAA